MLFIGLAAFLIGSVVIPAIFYKQIVELILRPSILENSTGMSETFDKIGFARNVAKYPAKQIRSGMTWRSQKQVLESNNEIATSLRSHKVATFVPRKDKREE